MNARYCSFICNALGSHFVLHVSTCLYMYVNATPHSSPFSNALIVISLKVCSMSFSQFEELKRYQRSKYFFPPEDKIREFCRNLWCLSESEWVNSIWTYMHTHAGLLGTLHNSFRWWISSVKCIHCHNYRQGRYPAWCTYIQNCLFLTLSSLSTFWRHENLLKSFEVAPLLIIYWPLSPRLYDTSLQTEPREETDLWVDVIIVV